MTCKGPIAHIGGVVSGIIVPPTAGGLRGVDATGGGGFGAPRTRDGNSYGHKGIDYAAVAGSLVYAPICGRVTQYGFAYDPEIPLHSIHIEGPPRSLFKGFHLKLLYVALSGLTLDYIQQGMEIGTAEDVAGHHGGDMINHVHLELYIDGSLVDPSPYLMSRVP